MQKEKQTKVAIPKNKFLEKIFNFDLFKHNPMYMSVFVMTAAIFGGLIYLNYSIVDGINTETQASILETMQDQAIEVLDLNCDKHKLSAKDTPSVPNIQEDGLAQNDTVSGQVQPAAVDDVLKRVTENPDNAISMGSILKMS